MTELTARQREIKALLDKGIGAREIGDTLGITRNAVYQTIQRMRRDGVLPRDWTPTGVPTREMPGADVLQRLLANGNGAGDDGSELVTAGTSALIEELRRTRDECAAIARRLARIVPD